MAWRSGHVAFVVAFGELLSTVLRFIQPLLIGLAINGVIGRNLYGLLVGICALAVSLGVGAVIEAVAVSYRVRLIDDVGFAYDHDLVKTLGQIKLLDILEEPRIASSIGRAKDRADAMGYCYNGLMSTLIQLTAPVTSIIVAAFVDPRLLLLLIAAAPLIIISHKLNRMMSRAEDETQASVSGAGAWAGLINDPSASAERQLFKLWPWYTAHIRRSVNHRERKLGDAARLQSFWALAGEWFYLLCLGVILFLIVENRPTIAAGSIAAALLVGLDLRGALSALRYALSGLGPGLRAGVALMEVRNAATVAIGDTKEGSHSVSLSQCAFVGVSYRYNDGTAALKDVTLKIPAGSVVALVGRNGAGKSTFVELALGLRRASNGTVNTLSGDQAVLAQRFAKFEFIMQDAVSLGRAPVDASPAQTVEGVLSRAAGREFWSQFASGVNKQLGAQWPDGHDLSEGQWQSLAGARALYANASLLALDEPTSALDPESQESATEHLLSECRNVARRGGIALLVTHRMSIPHRADLIVVFEEGEVVEIGDHVSLLDRSGYYADAYNAAAASFRS